MTYDIFTHGQGEALANPPLPLAFEIAIAPHGKGRPRVTRAGVYTPSKTRKWESDFRALADRFRPDRQLDGFIWAPVQPDSDNVRKAVLDALAAFWVDDRQVVAGGTAKVYAERWGQPRIKVRIKVPNDPEITICPSHLDDVPSLKTAIEHAREVDDEYEKYLARIAQEDAET